MMKATHPLHFQDIAIGLVLATLSLGMPPLATAQGNPLSAKMIQDRDFPSRSNTEAGRRILANAPPVAPGYRQFMGFIFAVLSSEAAVVPLTPPVPEDVSAHPDLTYLTVGDTELKLDLYGPKTMAEPAPLVALIHGGCWMDGPREEMGFYGVNLARRG